MSFPGLLYVSAFPLSKFADWTDFALDIRMTGHR
jgi:hypothetical protein